MENVIFISNPSEFEKNEAFVAHISRINGVKHLFNLLCEKLWFPNYFGFNWDATDECLNDFSWIEEVDIIIVHDSAINLDKKDFEIYIDMLYNAVMFWCSDGEHNMSIVFRTDYKEIIEDIIKKKRYV